jgi:hypothetical protein
MQKSPDRIWGETRYEGMQGTVIRGLHDIFSFIEGKECTALAFRQPRMGAIRKKMRTAIVYG